jgi:hypothetical protein
MKKVITTIALLVSLGATLYAQLPTFEWRLENEQLTSATTYQFDVNIYNTGSTAFEIRGGTIAFMLDTAWSRRGTLTVTTPSSGLVAGQQGAAASFANQTATAAAYFRKIITTVGATVGTTIPANSVVKCFTIVLTNTVAYSTTVPPRFTWKFTSTAPAAGFNYTDGSNNSAAVVTNAQGSNPITVITNQAFCYTPIYWNGTIWRTANQTTNASVTPTPSAILDAVVFNGTVADGFNCRHYNLQSGRTHTLNSGILNIAGNATINGTLSSASGTINLIGSAFTANQTLSGSLSSLSVANLGFGLASNAGTKTISVPAIVTGAVTQSGTATLAATGGLTLKSSSTSTARIAALSSGSAITGTITAERFIPVNTARRWRFLASPVVGGNTLQWRDNAGNTAGRGIQITGSTGTVDANIPNPSVLKYNESSSAGSSNINSKWEALDGNTPLQNGAGYRAFIRGDRSATPSNQVLNSTTIWVSGTYPSTPVNIPITYNSSLGNGWNLVGNPFPSPIDWNASSGWTKTNILGTVWIWNPITNSYGAFDGTNTLNSVTRYIASGQAFFIQANGSNPALVINESVKVSNTPSNMFKTSERNSLRIKLSTGSDQSDETIVHFKDGKLDEFISDEDIFKPFMNPEVNISSFFGQDKYAMVNYLDIKSINAKIVPLSAWLLNEGVYTMSFSQIDGFNSDVNIYLKDNYKNTITDLRVNDTYAFNVDAQKESTQDGRLELIFVNKTSSVESVLAGRKASLNVYPNPAIDVLNIEVLNANFKNSVVTIYNVSGVEVMSVDMIGNKKSLDIEKLTSGAYLVKVSNSENGYTNTVKFIK